MFVYQNVNRNICVTFESNKPVANPEYVIHIDHDNKKIFVNDVEMVAASEEAASEPVVEETETPVDGDTTVDPEDSTDPETTEPDDAGDGEETDAE